MVTLPARTGNSYELPPEGTHIAVCYRVIDLGTQQINWQGSVKHKPKIMISWELPDELMANGEPFTVHNQYILSNSEKSTLMKHLQAWRGVPFNDNDLGQFKIESLLGKACLLSINHNETDKGKFSNIVSISRLMKGMTPKELVNGMVHLDLKDFNGPVYETLSEGLKNTISKSPEYAEIMGKGTTRPEVIAACDLDDEIPF